MSFTPVVNERHNRQEMNSLHVNSTVNHLLCLLRQLPEGLCTWLVYVREWKTSHRLMAE